MYPLLNVFEAREKWKRKTNVCESRGCGVLGEGIRDKIQKKGE